MNHVLIGTALALVLAAPAAAEPSIFADKDAGAYVGIEGGMWFPDKLKVEIDDDGDDFLDYSVERDVGYDIDLIAGYDFGMFRVEGELAYKRVSHGDADLDFFDNGQFSEEFDDDGDTSAFSAMGNVLLDFGGPEEVNLFVGGGLGWAKVKVDTELDGRLYSESGFAWQLLAGARYPINRNWDVGVKYRYADLGDYDDSEDGANLSVGSLQSHSAMFSIIYNFAAAAPPPPPPPPPPPMAPPPPATQTCPDGSVILATDACPPPPPPPPPPPEPERG